MKFGNIFTYYRDDYVVCVKLLYTFLVSTQYDYGGKFRHCVNVCMHMYALACGKLCVCVCVCACVHRAAHLNRMYIHAVNVSFVLS